MMSARVDGDFQSARAAFALAAGWTREFERALETVRHAVKRGMRPGTQSDIAPAALIAEG